LGSVAGSIWSLSLHFSREDRVLENSPSSVPGFKSHVVDGAVSTRLKS